VSNAVFDADCDSSAVITSDWTVGDIELKTGYIGTVTQNTGITVTIDTDDLIVTGGTFAGGDSMIVVADDVLVNGGILTLTSGTTQIAGSFTYSSGTFNDNAGTVAMSGGTGAETITSAGVSFNNLMITDGLVGYWKLDETALDTCNGGADDFCDSSVNSNHGDETGGVTISTDTAPVNFSNDRGLNLDGVDDYVTLAAGVISAISGGTEITLAGWFKGSQVQSFIRLQRSGGYIVIAWGGSEKSIISTDGGTGGGLDYGGFNIEDGLWHHVAMTWKKNTINGWVTYIDGNIANQKNSANVNLPVMSGTSWLGTYGGGELTNGQIDDIRIYNRALSAGEITALASGTHSAGGTKVTLEDTLDVNGDLTISFGDLDNNSAEDNTINLAGSWLNLNRGGLFTNDGGVVVLDATTGTHSILGGDQGFYDLQVNGTGGTWNLTGDMIVDNNLIVDAGTLDLATYNAAITNDLDVNGGTLDLSTGITSVSGTVDFTGATAITTDTSSSLVLVPSGAQTLKVAGKALNDVVLSSTDGLVGWWKFDETSAGTFADSSVNINTGTGVGVTAPNNTPQPSTNVAPVNFTNARGLDLDGVDDHVDVGSTADHDLINNFTFAVWIYPTVSISQSIMTKRNSVNNWPYAFFLWGTEQLKLYSNSGATVDVTASDILSLNAWTHVAVTRSGTTITFYINGVADSGGSQILAAGASAAGAPLWIGAQTTDGSTSLSEYTGSMDDVRIYNRALTVAEVAALAAGHPMSTTGTVTLQDNLDVNGDMILGDGTFAAGAQTINIANDWIMGDAMFTAGTSTVNFDDDTVPNTINGNTTFYNLDISTGTAKTVTFESGATTTIDVSGSLTFTGASGQLLTLAPQTAATDWLLTDNGASQSISYASVTYSDASAGTAINAQDGTNVDGAPGDTNTNWSFSLPVVSGITAVQRTDGTGIVDISVDVTDSDSGGVVELKVQYGPDDPGVSDPTLDTSNVTAQDGAVPNVDNTPEYQVGSVTKIATAIANNTITFDWLSQTDEPTLSDTSYFITITPEQRAVPRHLRLIMSHRLLSMRHFMIWMLMEMLMKF